MLTDLGPMHGDGTAAAPGNPSPSGSNEFVEGAGRHVDPSLDGSHGHSANRRRSRPAQSGGSGDERSHESVEAVLVRRTQVPNGRLLEVHGKAVLQLLHGADAAQAPGSSSRRRVDLQYRPLKAKPVYRPADGFPLVEEVGASKRGDAEAVR